MTASERIKTMQMYRLARLAQESLEQHQSDPCRNQWTKDDDVLLSEATAQEQALYADATAIASRITGTYAQYQMRDLVEWWFLRDTPWDYVIDGDWCNGERAMLDAIAAVAY